MKMKKSQFSESQIFSILKEAEVGIPIAELCHKYGMSDASFYKWRAKHGGMCVSMTCMKELEEGNRCLKKMYAESRMDAEIIREAMGKSRKAITAQVIAKRAVAKRGITIRRACRLFSISENCYRYRPKHQAENRHIAGWLLRLTTASRTWVFGLCLLYLRNVRGYGVVSNKFRTFNRQCCPKNRHR